LQEASPSRRPFGFFRDRRGVTAIEYAFIASLVAVVIVTAAATLGTRLSGLFNSLTSGF
jgi:pilus assembly protein Flp/PilA